MQQLEIYQNGFDYSKWDDSSFKYNELNVALTSVQLGGGIIKDPRFSGFFVTIIYGVEYNGVRIFSFEGTVYYSYPKSFKSIHLLTFLCEKSINEFHDEFIKRKGGTPLQRYTINKRHVSELFDDIHEVLSLKQSQEQG